MYPMIPSAIIMYCFLPESFPDCLLVLCACSSVKHNTRCEASCGSGYKGSYYSKCVNGEWTDIGGGCYN
jgi:hypothetical protein